MVTQLQEGEKMDINSLLDKYQNILSLKDWEIELIEDDAIEVEAETKTLYNDYKAIIRIDKSNKLEIQEVSLIHELLHLIYRDAYDIFSENVENDFARKYCARQHERAIEKTAKIIYALNHK